jgi:HAD superfamily hydrolase (TIGR01484 family)
VTVPAWPRANEIRVFAFDLDDTLAESKQRLTPTMARALHDLLGVSDVLVISGARWEQFQSQVLGALPDDPRLERLHLMPTCGTRYLRWHDGMWVEQYAHDLHPAVKESVLRAIEEEARRLGHWYDEQQTWGERIEDRGSQVTYSALGQSAPIPAKRAWDPTGTKRQALRTALSERLPDLEVRMGGSTSIDITERGVDKAYGVGRLIDMLAIRPEQVHFVGDRLEPGGNDFPVVALGVSTRAVADWEETLEHIRQILAGVTTQRHSS